jgi:YidC/Oxa1 family membrane protein insertase
MERRVFIAILLSMVVFYGYQTMFPPPEAPKPPPTAANPSSAETAASEETVATPEQTATPGAKAVSAEPAPAGLTTEPAEREITVETARVQAVFSNRGARLVHWRLKDYRDARGEAVDLIPSSLPAGETTPFTLRVDNAGVTQRLNGALYKVTGERNGRVDATSAQATVTFEYEDAAGLRARKEFRFEPQTYVVSLSLDVRNGAEALNPTILWGPGLGDVGATSGGGSFFTGNYVQPPQAIFHRDGDVERITGSSLTEQPVHEGVFRFAGIDDHYFLATAINPGQARFEFRTRTIAAEANTQRVFVTQSLRLQQPPQNLRFFVGPKQFDVLQRADAELVRAIHFGMFAWVVVPLLSTLKWLYGFIGNYGLAIIVLTILINLAMFPLRHKSVVAMRKMQLIQPEIKAIQDRYAHLKMTDPGRQKMNTEVMDLYRKKGVNPASGCIPMVLTMPVLLAFYSLLSMSIELRGASFAGWIHDLSAADPFYVLPVLMGVTMFWQQRITPTSADPAQQKVMMIMPLMFTGMMLFSPSGVVLYWFVSNVWAIGQQYVTNRLIGPAAAPAPRPPAERRLKNAGSGKTAAAEKP